MKKEYLFIFAVALFIFAHVVDSVSGSINLMVKSPFDFLDPIAMAKFPLTAVGIFTRALGIFISVLLLLSLVDKMFYVKAITTFLLAALFNLFAIQQIATNTRTVTIQWTLSLAFSGLWLLLPSIIYLVKGFIHPIFNKDNVITPSENL